MTPKTDGSPPMLTTRYRINRNAVTVTVERLVRERGAPARLCMDNCPEPASAARGV